MGDFTWKMMSLLFVQKGGTGTSTLILFILLCGGFDSAIPQTNSNLTARCNTNKLYWKRLQTTKMADQFDHTVGVFGSWVACPYKESRLHE